MLEHERLKPCGGRGLGACIPLLLLTAVPKRCHGWESPLPLSQVSSSRACCTVCIPAARDNSESSILTLPERIGAFIPLFLVACCVQWRKRSKKRSVNVVMVFTTVFYGLTITSVCSIQNHAPLWVFLADSFQHWVVSFIHALRGILCLPPGGNTEGFFGNTSNPLFVCKLTLLQIKVLVADWIMVIIVTLVG